MIDIKSFGSGSAGNCYLIDDGSSQIIIECGVRFELVKQHMRFDLSRVAGLVISHEHGDHSKEIKKVLKTTSIEVFASKGTLDALDVPRFRRKDLKSRHVYPIGSWKVTPFDVIHDVAEPFGYLFENKAGEKLLFLTDTEFTPYRFKGITHMLVEANYSTERLLHRSNQGEIVHSLKNRVFGNHMSFENTKEFIKANVTEALQEVWLIHLSDGNSDEQAFKREIQELTGVPVYLA